jgi:hypothetical protein
VSGQPHALIHAWNIFKFVVCISDSVMQIVASANGTIESLSLQTAPVVDREEWKVFIEIRVFRNFHDSECLNCGLLGCDTMRSSRWIQFWRDVLPQFSELKVG